MPAPPSHQSGFLRRYIKSYAWQSLSLVVNFLSMFIVTPMLTSNPAVYGIYVLCISFNLFLAYADLGFVGAGYKFASESHARGEESQVLRIVGFMSAILFSFVAVFSVLMLVFAAYPDLLVKNLTTPEQRQTASQLLLILAVFSPSIIWQRSLQVLFGIRVEEYLLQRVLIVGNLLKILSVVYFFRAETYDIVGYFLFSQVVSLACAAINLLIASRRYQFHIRAFFGAIRFSKDLFSLLGSLAASSLLTVGAWVVFYELDPFAISKLLGPDALAIYAIGLTLMSFLRGLLSILYNPFNARFNHFIGVGDLDGLRAFYRMVVEVVLPVAVLPLLTLELLLAPFIESWVGVAYVSSVPLATILLASYAFNFVSYPSGILLVAQKRLKESNLISVSGAVVFWFGMILCLGPLGIYAFAEMKTLVFVLMGLWYLNVSRRFLGASFWTLVGESILPLLLSVLLVVSAAWLVGPWLPRQKGVVNLATTVAAIGGVSAGAIGVYVFASRPYRAILGQLVQRLFPGKAGASS